jgi:hypothetical protein
MITEYQARMVREGLIQASDYIVLMYTEKGADVPQNWVDYRQALRDVPEQSGFPTDVIWPTHPE